MEKVVIKFVEENGMCFSIIFFIGMFGLVIFLEYMECYFYVWISGMLKGEVVCYV